MGKRHNTLSDDIFRNCKYLKTLEQELEINDFKKDYKEQYDIMFDVYKTLIVLNNIFFADSNKNKKEKTNELLETLEKAIYRSIDDDRAKYSTRTIKALYDTNTRLLYNKYNEWYESLSYNDNYFDTLKTEIDEEMTKLENVGFDLLVKDNMQYEKNKNSNYKIFVSKLDYLYSSDVWEDYKQDFYNTYGIELNDKEINDIYFVYKLVAYANNGIVKLMFPDSLKGFKINAKSNAEDYFKLYLTHLNIDLTNNDKFMHKANIFLNELIITNNVITELLENDTKNEHIITISKMETEPFIANYDLYYFYLNMTKITNNLYEFTIKSDVILKIINDLKEIYKLLYDNVPNINEDEQVKLAFDKVQSIIERNKKMFERLS